MAQHHIPSAAGRIALAIVVLVAGMSIPSIAEQPAAPGTVTGTVIDSSGKPAGSVTVYFFGSMDQQQQRGGGDAGRRGPKGRSTDLTPEPTLLAKGVMKGKVTTDAQGKFEIKTLTAGTYSYRAGNPTTVGMAGGELTVEAGKSVAVEIKLNPPSR